VLRRPWSGTGLRVTATVALLSTAIGAGTIVAGFPAGSGRAAEPDNAALSAAAADQFVTGASTGFDRAPGESFTRQSVITTESGLNYVNYSRTYENLRVFVGGDVVVITDRSGGIRSSTAGSPPIKVDTRAKVSAAAATSVVRREHPGEVAGRPALGVVAGDQTVLVWQVVVEGPSSRVHAFVDAHTGRYVGSWNEVSTGGGIDRNGAAVDARYAGAVMRDMLKTRFNRDGIDGRGGTATMFAGDASYSCAETSSAANDETRYGYRQITSIGVVAHELGHGVFCHTPGGDSGTSNETGGLNEGTGDIFGTLAEHFAAGPVGLAGGGPIRDMSGVSKAGDPNCWSPAIPATEVHSAAGPLDHWFYLTAEGSGPASPTCDRSTVKGIGLWPAGEIFYHALLRKTSGWTYRKARKATLEAALDLHPGSCAEFDAVKAAWNAVSVPSEQDPACTAAPAYTAWSLTGGTAPRPMAGSRFENPADFDILDRTVVESPITVRLAGNAPKTLKVDVDITHGSRGDLRIDLIAPDGSSYRIKSSDRLDPADDVKETVTVDASAEPATGTWKLRVRDQCTGDTGVLNSWALLLTEALPAGTRAVRVVHPIIRPMGSTA